MWQALVWYTGNGKVSITILNSKRHIFYNVYTKHYTLYKINSYMQCTNISLRSLNIIYIWTTWKTSSLYFIHLFVFHILFDIFYHLKTMWHTGWNTIGTYHYCERVFCFTTAACYMYDKWATWSYDSIRNWNIVHCLTRQVLICIWYKVHTYVSLFLYSWYCNKHDVNI